MSRARHDQLAKGMLTEWLEPLGSVEVEKGLRSEERAVDVVAHAYRANPSWRSALGLWGQMARGWMGIEVYRNAVGVEEVASGQAKGIDLWAELVRRAKRRGLPRGRVKRPTMWVVTPTLSAQQRKQLALRPMPGWPQGFLHVAAGWGVAVVVVHDLVQTEGTLFLRLFGRGRVQGQALAELDALPSGHPLRRPTAIHVLRFRREAELAIRPTAEQREILMQTQAWVEKWERDLIAQGEAAGEARGEAAGEARGKAEAVLAVLRAREVEVDSETEERILECEDLRQLERWLTRAAKATQVEELFASAKKSAPRRGARKTKR